MRPSSEEAAPYVLAAHSFNALTVVLSAGGVSCNALLLYTTLRSKSLRTPCNILIGICALFDVMHQLGTITQSLHIYRGAPMHSKTCSIIMFLPEMGVAGGTFTVLSIGIDRLLSIALPNKYRTMDVKTYLSMQCAAICVYCAYDAFLMTFFHTDQHAVCSTPSVYHGVAVALWAYSGAIFNLLAFLTYFITWRLIKAHSSRFEHSSTGRIFRTIVLVTIFDLGGWAVTQIIVATTSVISMPDYKRFFSVCLAGIFVNLGIAVKFFVYYFTSTDYRRAIKYQFNCKQEEEKGASIVRSGVNQNTNTPRSRPIEKSSLIVCEPVRAESEVFI